MASEVVYAAVSPKEGAHFASEAPDTGDSITYAQVKVKWRSDRAESTPKMKHSVTCLENSHWWYVVVALVFTAVILLIIVILLAVNCSRDGQ